MAGELLARAHMQGLSFNFEILQADSGILTNGQESKQQTRADLSIEIIPQIETHDLPPACCRAPARSLRVPPETGCSPFLPPHGDVNIHSAAPSSRACDAARACDAKCRARSPRSQPVLHDQTRPLPI